MLQEDRSKYHLAFEACWRENARCAVRDLAPTDARDWLEVFQLTEGAWRSAYNREGDPGAPLSEAFAWLDLDDEFTSTGPRRTDVVVIA